MGWRSRRSIARIGRIDGVIPFRRQDLTPSYSAKLASMENDDGDRARQDFGALENAD